MDYYSLIIGVASLVLAMIALIIMNLKSQKNRREIEKSVESMKTEDFALDVLAFDGKGVDKDIVGQSRDKIVAELLKNYHDQALMQASVQFWFSLFAAVAGFVFIIITILNNTHNMEWFDYVVKVLPGVIIEAVSVLFFQQSKEMRSRATKFFDRLREDEKIERSIDIAESISDEKMKSDVKSKIALHISGISSVEEKE
ncbi:MAG: hypothetical protein AB1Z19_00525 [Eubacteriales bacterium]